VTIEELPLVEAILGILIRSGILIYYLGPPDNILKSWKYRSDIRPGDMEKQIFSAGVMGGCSLEWLHSQPGY
jgi:hypothetical protein